MGTTEGRRQRKVRHTRAALASTALRLVLERGLAAVSVEDVTEQVDVSRRTFNRYFSSKEDAVLDGWRADCERINAALARRPAAERPLDAYRSALRAWLADEASPALHRRPEGRALFRLAAEEPALTAVLRRINVGAEEESIGIVAARLGLDPARDLRPAVAVGAGAAVLMAAVRAWVRAEGAAGLPELVESAFRALAAEPPPSPDGRPIPPISERKDPS
ncbi:TetR family transcriptional regulator [Phaeacidiphilus oryzae]|jgi:AcrR family transcriptional regulator|uniref:TetR family transcriptional regulator n=1 Tax=Phaeacidiphilus oryzae TaxID=348818 RepID=UPI00068FF5C0|nr:TetR family transcriptional regulator [Phaeacidiphilus oryzae]